MKVRYGFVSNSSSSSFVCDVCGETESGYDISLRDVYMVTCKNGHCFCESHAVNGFDVDILDDEDNPEYDEEWRWYLNIKYCPICQMEFVEDSDMVKYLLKKFDKTENEVKKDILDTFKTYDEFQAWLK